MLTLIKNMAQISLSLDNKEILERFSDVDEAFETLKKIINYEERLNKSFTFQGDNFNFWLKNIFTDINDGKIETAPMPLKIIIKICESDMQFKMPEYINSIIDTRGLDGGERPDIQSYILRNNSISFMCDEINGYGGNESICSILQQTLIKEDKDRHLRVLLLGMEKNSELENITNFEDDRKGGMKSKKSQALKKINDSQIKFDDDNFLFFDTAPGINIEKGKITKVDKDILENTQKEFINTVESIILKMYSKYCDELYESLGLLEQLNRGQITQKTLQKINDSYQIVSDIVLAVRAINNDILSKFKESVCSIYHSSLRGAVNHNGIGNTADIYGSFQKCGGEDFIEKCREYKTIMLTSINIIFKNCPEFEMICLKYINDSIDDLYNKHYTNYRNLTYSETYNSLYNYNSWMSPKKYWGDGLGNYNLRVWNDISQEIKQYNIDKKLDNQNNKVQFFQDVLNFLKI